MDDEEILDDKYDIDEVCEPVEKMRNQRIPRICLNCSKDFKAPNKVTRLCKNCRMLPKYKFGTMHEGGEE